MTKNKRVEFYRRLPEIYRIKDEELPKHFVYESGAAVPYQLRSYLEPVEGMFSAIHENIESLYHDFFIEHCDPWVIPYIADLLGTSHISGDEWTLRADVADTIALRRRKGTLGAIELLAFVLTKWGVHSVELLENMVWNQHLNHQRPDEGGTPPYSLLKIRPATPIRGGTVSLRDPSLLALLNTPFDPFAHVADVNPHETGQVRYNLPNLAIYLWRLKDYRLEAIRPHLLKVAPEAHPLATAKYPQAARVVRVNIDPVPVNDISRPYVLTAPKDNRPEGRPVTIFNTSRLELFDNSRVGTDSLNTSAISPRVSSADQVAGPILRERVSDYDVAKTYDDALASQPGVPLEVFTNASFTAPQEYFSVNTYDDLAAGPLNVGISDVGLQLHLPQSETFGSHWPHLALPRHWKIRGENLNAWERGLNPPLNDKEIAIDPESGRIAIGVSGDARADALVEKLMLTFTYGAVGSVGAHPISYPALPDEFSDVARLEVSFHDPSKRLQPVLKKALKDVREAGGAPPAAIVIEITDSRTYQLEINDLELGDKNSELGTSILLHCPLIIRAADNQRPVIELARPLAFRPAEVVGATPAEQKVLDARMEAMFVRLEGLYISRGVDFAPSLPLISRAALGRLEVLSCTLDPGGFRKHICDDSGYLLAPKQPAINVREPYGFVDADEELEFKQTPELVIQRSICGSVFTDEGYRLCLEDSIIESTPVAVPQSAGPAIEFPFAVTGATDPATGFAGTSIIRNVTVLGRVRTSTIDGSGGIFTGVVQLFDQQAGCLKYCYFADDSGSPPPPDEVKNLLPQHFACVFGGDARLIFTSEVFGAAGYCQLSLECDQRILEEGVGNDQMGAFNFLQEAHKWRNLKIRFREFMPVGIRPLLIPVT